MSAQVNAPGTVSARHPPVSVRLEGDLGERRMIPGLGSPFPLVEQVPAIFAEDSFLNRMLPCLDEVLAPIISVLDCFDSYLDPWIAPPDMVRYLGSWIQGAVHFEEEETEDALRYAVAYGQNISKWGGTEQGLRNRLIPYEVRELVIDEPGSVLVSQVPTDQTGWADGSQPRATITYTPVEDSPGSRLRIARIIRNLVPAHVLVTIVVGTATESP